MVSNAIRRGFEMDSTYGSAPMEEYPTNGGPFIGPFNEVNAPFMGVAAYGGGPGLLRRETSPRTPSSKCIQKLEAI